MLQLLIGTAVGLLFGYGIGGLRTAHSILLEHAKSEIFGVETKLVREFKDAVGKYKAALLKKAN